MKIDIDALSGQEIIESINKGEMSLLEQLDAKKLHDEMRFTGLVCKLFVNSICKEKDDAKLRQNAIRKMTKLAPSATLAEFPKTDDCIVLGFNHPSLGEIFRLILIGFKEYPEKTFLFPVNLPWYENIAVLIPKLERMGISITPMITPSTEAKLISICNGDESKLARVQRYKTLLERKYMKTAREFAQHKASIFVAPSATRQSTVFPDEAAANGTGHIHPTMTLLAHMVMPKPECSALFLPVAVFEPQNGNRMLNLKKEYGIYPCVPFTADETREMTSGHERNFDYHFLKRIDSIYKNRNEFYK